MTKKSPVPILCPHCTAELAPAFIRSQASRIAGSAKRPGAKGLVRNPTGKSKPACEHCAGTKLINGQECGWCNGKRARATTPPTACAAGE